MRIGYDLQDAGEHPGTTGATGSAQQVVWSGGHWQCGKEIRTPSCFEGDEATNQLRSGSRITISSLESSEQSLPHHNAYRLLIASDCRAFHLQPPFTPNNFSPT